MDRQLEHGKPAEPRYAYYRRCQEFCRRGEQCKAPAEKGADICYAHARQRAMEARRAAERRGVLAAAVMEMRRRGNAEFEMADLFMSFNGIHVTIATVAQALIAGRIDCKTAGRLLWDLQKMAKLLRIVHREESRILPQISADERRSKRVEGTKEMGLAANEREKARIIKPTVMLLPCNRRSNSPPEWARAA